MLHDSADRMEYRESHRLRIGGLPVRFQLILRDPNWPPSDSGQRREPVEVLVGSPSKEALN